MVLTESQRTSELGRNLLKIHACMKRLERMQHLHLRQPEINRQRERDNQSVSSVSSLQHDISTVGSD